MDTKHYGKYWRNIVTQGYRKGVNPKKCNFTPTDPIRGICISNSIVSKKKKKEPDNVCNEFSTQNCESLVGGINFRSNNRVRQKDPHRDSRTRRNAQ